MTFDADGARQLALLRWPCPWCDQQLRPCNWQRHIDAHHFSQLTLDEVLEQIKRGERT